MLNIITVAVLLLLAALFLFLAVRAARARRAYIRWPGMVLAGLLGIIFLVVTGVGLYGFYKLTVPPHRYAVQDVKVAGTAEQVARGERLAYICADCHASAYGQLPLDGSAGNMMEGGPPIGVLYGTNLTPGGPLKDWTDGEIIRAIREGVGKDGRPLFAMASETFRYFSDEDAQALVAYLRSQPAVERDLPRRDINLLGALFVGAGLAPTSAQPPVTAAIPAPAAGTLEYGKYLVDATGCRDCHGPELTGPINPFVPPGPNITVAIPNYDEAQFITLFRTGVNNTGRAVDTRSMPWQSYNHAFTDGELRDIYAYLRGLPLVQSASK